MKKMLKTFGIIVILTVIGLGMSACKDDKTETSCSHSYSDWTTKTEATCAAAKVEKRVCSLCNNEETRNEGEPLGTHSYSSWTTKTEATCIAAKVEKRICAICELEETQNIGDPLDTAHNYSISEITEGVTAKTCNNGCNEKSDFVFAYSVGDIIPNRGIITYVADGQSGRSLGFTVQGYGNSGDVGYFAEYTAYYLEAAPETLEQRRWAEVQGHLIPGLSQNGTDETDWGIGRGRFNTAAIIADSVANDYTAPAASFCAALTTGGKQDWFLPSINELLTIIQFSEQFGFPETVVLWPGGPAQSAYISSSSSGGRQGVHACYTYSGSLDQIQRLNHIAFNLAFRAF